MNLDSIEIPEDFVFVDVGDHVPSMATPLRYEEISRVLVNHIGAFAHPKNPKNSGIKIIERPTDFDSRTGSGAFDAGTPRFEYWIKRAYIDQVMK